MRDAFEKDLLQVLPHRFDFCSEGHMSDTFDYYVLPSKGEEQLVLEAEEDEFFMKKINWKQILHTQILQKDSYDKNFHSKDVLIEFMNNNQGSIERFESQCERLFEQVVEFEKLKIEDKFNVVGKKEDEGESKNIKDDIVGKDTQKSQLWGELDAQPNIHQQNISPIYFSNKAGKKEEIDEVLDAIYDLFIVVHLKRIWKQHHLFLKFMEFLTNKRKKKDDEFFVSYMPP
ncbi:hypothetical protein MTR_0718s0010 [Medicago truncatula]|uniref:Uncharacterized protein n=1 Tax=Medicago truncatula TaxID=3880 RepID=A0A072TF12_MEDTR|nr:hypothetical protein MTR_0718s0010 [Medicago truncatula]